MAEHQTWTVTEPYLDIRCKLGEGPYYVPERNELRFVDINDYKIHRVNLDEGPSSLKTVDTKLPVGVAVDIEGVDSSETILVGAKDGVAKFNLRTGEYDYLAKYWDELPKEEAEEKFRRIRSNDGAVDDQGRFWVSTMVDPEIDEVTTEGRLYRWAKSSGLKIMQEEVSIGNGISWAQEKGTMYYTDTVAQKVYAYDFAAETGEISNRKVMFDSSRDGSNPDGHALDAQGNTWHACYGSSKVIRVSPDGVITGTISLPTRNVTCPVFVGTELFITTAKEEDGVKYPESARYAGSVFRVDVGVQGVLKNKAKLDS